MKMIWLNFHDIIPNTLLEIIIKSTKITSFRLQFTINKYRWYIEC